MARLEIVSMYFEETCTQNTEGFPGSIMSWVRVNFAEFSIMLPQHELLQEVPGGFANFIKVF